MDLEIDDDKQKRQAAEIMRRFSRELQDGFNYPDISIDTLPERNRYGRAPPDSTTDLGIMGARQHDLDKRFDRMEQKHDRMEQKHDTLEHELKFRLNVIEQKLNVTSSDNIVAFAKAVFTTLKIIEQVHITPIQYGFQFIIIHNAETAPEAISQTRAGMNMLEDAFPDLYFERLVLHTSEVHEEHLQQAKLILERQK